MTTTRKAPALVRRGRSVKRARSLRINVILAALGRTPRRLRLQPGTTLGDLVFQQRLRDITLRINRRAVPLATELRDGDVVAVVPAEIVGGAKDPHAHLDLERYQREMTAQDYASFVRFVGADHIGFRPEDLDQA